MDHCALVDIKNSNDVSALMYASRKSHTSFVHVLVPNGVQAVVHDIAVETALMLASYRGHTAIVQLLLDHVHL